MEGAEAKGISFPTRESEEEFDYAGKKYKFKFREFKGQEADRFTDEAKTMNVEEIDGEAKTMLNISIAKLNRIRAIEGTLEAYQDGVKFEMKDYIDQLPPPLYNFIVKQIDKINKLDNIEIKKLDRE